ncbi:hypothetical protein PROFUN_15371 [Planoprotostelium fungivorum]|uniref:Uncharacterized protein n=1 Tax=Planoprotostelium fungivorum TaxID=1890364 RepID=A0A2P6MW27_9EUKA|nr:hypothetical protein PROFUN_15371 [Planoprotostelium fungivorum]
MNIIKFSSGINLLSQIELSVLEHHKRYNPFLLMNLTQSVLAMHAQTAQILGNCMFVPCIYHQEIRRRILQIFRGCQVENKYPRNPE